MARFCSECGSPLQEGGRFCPNCGTPVDPAPAPRPPFSAPGPAPRPPYAAVPAAKPAKKNNSLWLIFIIAAALALLLLIAAAGKMEREDGSAGYGAEDGTETEPIAEPEATAEPEPEPEPEAEPEAPLPTEPEGDGSWTFCFYLCSADLERLAYYTSENLVGIAEAGLPENVSVIAQTGGGRGLHLSEFGVVGAKDRKLQRWKIGDGSIDLLEEEALGNMGEAETLADFLSFCRENYPAEHTVVMLQDHGGGGGICYDEFYDSDSLTLLEVREAFDSAFELSKDAPPVDLVFFNSCLMGTIDSCIALRDVSHYFLASEEIGWTWNYSGVFEKLAKDPAMSVEDFGRCVIDAYAETFRGHSEAEIYDTMALVDLTLADGLIDAYHTFGADLLRASAEDWSVVTRFCANAESAMPLGCENDSEGYDNQLDLGSLAARYAGSFDSARKVLSGLGKAVIAYHHGPYHRGTYGLGCYYPYDADFSFARDYYVNVTGSSAADCFYYLYQYALTGVFDSRAWRLIGSEEQVAAAPKHVADIALEDLLLNVGDDGITYLELDEDEMDAVKNALLQLYVDLDDGSYCWLGNTDEVVIDRENGLIYDTFFANVLCFNDSLDYLTYFELTYRDEKLARYELRALVNGELKKIHVVYDFATEVYSIVGYQDFSDADLRYAQAKPIVPFEDGDEITCVVYLGENILEEDDVVFEGFELNSFIYREGETVFGPVYDDGDDVFYFRYEIEDAAGNYVYSNYSMQEKVGDNITVSTVVPEGW